MEIEQGKTIIKILEKYSGQPIVIYLEDGQRLQVNDIVYGYDMGDDFAHVTTNISPPIDGVPIDFFYVNEIIKIEDSETGKVIYGN